MRRLTAAEVREHARLRELVWQRCRGRCEHAWCGEPLVLGCWELAHRVGGAGGRPWHGANLLGLHPGCHRDGPHGAHRNVTMARQLGLIVPSTGDPRTWPLLLPPALGGRWVLLDDEGGYQPVPPGYVTPGRAT